MTKNNLTIEQQNAILNHLENVKQRNRNIKTILTWGLVLTFTFPLNIYINISILPSLTTFFQGIFFEIGVLFTIGLLNFLALNIKYNMDSVSAVTYAAVVAFGVAAVVAAIISATIAIAVGVAVGVAVAVTYASVVSIPFWGIEDARNR